jgi:hypothetical protein
MQRAPSRTNLEAMRREARDLLHALRQRAAAALRRYHCVDPLAGLSQPSLAEARYVIAREYGYSSWQKLQRQFAGSLSDHRVKGAQQLEDHELPTPSRKSAI